MRLIVIDIKSEPDCLRKLRIGNRKYIDLKDDCKKIVLTLLNAFQNGFCAYCEQKFKSQVFIEHYISQKEDETKELEFSNFLGVCSGKEYSAPKISSKHIAHCGNSKQMKPLNLDPKNQEHINAIYYESDCTIKSKIENNDSDLNVVLNLNYDRLKQKRNEKFKSTFNNIIKTANLLKLSKAEILMKGLKYSENGQTEFSGFLTYRFKELIAAG